MAMEPKFDVERDISLFKRIKLGIEALTILNKKPDDTASATVFSAVMDKKKWLEQIERISKTSTGSSLLHDRPSLQLGVYNLEEMKNSKPGSLGQIWAQYYYDNGIMPFESPYNIRNDFDFMVTWYRETHDLHHIFTGYGTDEIGEMELQAFILGNLKLNQSIFILFFAALLRPRGLPPIWKYYDKLKAAYKRGKETNNIINVRYDLLFSEPIENLYKELNIAPLGAI